MARSSKVKVAPAPEKRFFIFVALKDGTTLRAAGEKVDLVSSYSGPITEVTANRVRSIMSYTSVKLLEFDTIDGWTFIVPKDNVAYLHFKEVTEDAPDA